jgi:AraC-like DNA-binding protein
MSPVDALPMIEAALRGGAVALLAVLALLLLRDARRSPAGPYAGLFAFSVAAYIIVTAPELLNHRPVLWLLPLRLASLGTPAMFWLFAKAAFDDGFVASWRDAAPWLGTVGVGFVCARGLLPEACILYHALQLVFVVLAIRLAIAGRAADLIEERRRFRVVLVFSSALYTGTVVMLEIFMGGPPSSPPLSTVNAAGLLALIFAYVIAQLTLTAPGQFVPLTPAEPQGFPPAAGRLAPAPPVDAQEPALLERLRRLMDEERIYREEGLGIAALAGRLAVPEYRLRRLINQRLGHRNFSSFVNGCRLADAMAALADHAQAEVPIVTIALDAGFQSLGPFNRAFKAHTGMTPTEYRRRHLAGAVPTSPHLADSEIGQPS